MNKKKENRNHKTDLLKHKAYNKKTTNLNGPVAQAG